MQEDLEIIDPAEAKKELGGIGNSKMYELLNAGKLEGVKIGKSLKIRKRSIRKLLAELPAYKPQSMGA